MVYRQHCYQPARGRLPDLGVLTVWVGPATAGYDPAPIGTDVDVTQVVLGPQGQCSERRAQVNDCCVRPARKRQHSPIPGGTERPVADGCLHGVLRGHPLRRAQAVALWRAGVHADGPAEDSVRIPTQEGTRGIKPKPALDRQVRRQQPPVRVRQVVEVVLDDRRGVRDQHPVFSAWGEPQ